MIMRIPILKSILWNLDWFEEARRHHVAPDGSILLGGTNHRLKKAGDWEESKHPRADDGKFTSGSGGGSKKPSKTKRKLERRAEAASQGRVSGAIQTLLSGGSALDKIGWLNTSKPKEPEKKPVEEKKPAPKQTEREPSILDTMAQSWARSDAARGKVPGLEHPSQQAVREGGREGGSSPRVLTPGERQYRENQGQWDADRRRMGIPVPGEELAELTIPGKKPEQQRLPKYEDIPGAERLVGGPGVIPFSTDKYGGWNGLYHSHDQKVIGKMENGLLRLDVYDAKSNKLLSSAKFDLKEDKNFGTNVKGKHGNVKINYLKVNKIPEGFPAYTDRAAIDRKLEVDEYVGNTRESITSTHPDMQRLAIHLDENGKIKSHQLIPITATVQDENAIYVPAFGNEAKAKRAIEDALLHGKYTKG